MCVALRVRICKQLPVMYIGRPTNSHPDTVYQSAVWNKWLYDIRLYLQYTQANLHAPVAITVGKDGKRYRSI